MEKPKHSTQAGSQGKPPAVKIITQNKRARHEYAIESDFEAGLVLTGSEVKSLRAGKASIDEAYVRVDGGHGGKPLEVVLVGATIAEYVWANRFNHESTRNRRLLLHGHEIDKIATRVREKGYTLVPIRLYFKGSRVKLEFGLGKGKKLYDKRQDLKEKDTKREISRALREQ
ncbi:MAG: SsrA-binding protein SmpB [Myxococcales bacterium]|nr:SsrA-binding protein SmpB [Myxococcales bacterium]